MEALGAEKKTTDHAQPLQYTLRSLACLNPPSTTRAWQTAAHATLPLAATSSSDRSVRVYSLTSFTLLSNITGGHKRSVRTCAWKPNIQNEAVLATGSFDASAGIWRKWEAVGESELDFTSAQLHEEDHGDEGEDDYRFTVLLEGHESEIKSVAWNAGGQYLATCSRDKSVWIWEEIGDDNFETVAVLQEHEADVKCVAWHPTEDLLASGSYDDSVRLYKEDIDDWLCVSLLNGHSSTVWCVQFEPGVTKAAWLGEERSLNELQRTYLQRRGSSGPRLASCSDDRTIRIWQRVANSVHSASTGQYRTPSILRSNNVEEEWVQQAILPRRHDRAIYAIAWSPITGLIASTGSDGKVVVYRERWAPEQTPGMVFSVNGAAKTKSAGLVDNDHDDDDGRDVNTESITEWEVVAEREGAHDVFEVNHITWSRRWDNERRNEDDEILITTADDGEVKIWVLEDG